MNDTLSEALNRALHSLRPDLAPPKPKKVKAPKEPHLDPQTAGFRKVHLVNQEDGHDKEYKMQIVKVGTLYEVKAEWGRIGKTLQKDTKTDRPCSLIQAETTFNKVLKEKKKKGYKEI